MKSKQDWIDEARTFIEGWEGIPTFEDVLDVCRQLAADLDSLAAMCSISGSVRDYAEELYSYIESEVNNND